MEFFILNILMELISPETGEFLIYLAVFISVVTFVFLFLRKKNKNNSEQIIESSNKISDNELQIKLRAYERLTLLLDRIEPIGMLNRLELNSIDNVDILTSVLIKNIISEYEYNMSQKIYVSDELWTLIGLVKNKIINSISIVSDSLNKKSTTDDFVKKMLVESVKNNLIIQKAQKCLKQEVRNIS